MRIVLTGGGTGGHVVPNIAVIEELKRREIDADILYVGSPAGVEKRMMEKLGITYTGVACGKLRRYFSWENFVDLFRVPLGVLQTLKVLRKFRPEIVFSKGGYVSVPVVIAAKILRIPVILHESDFSLGLANRVAAKLAGVVCTSFKETAVAGALYTGNIVRKSIAEGSVEAGRKFTGLDRYRPVILVMGGSQGARQINTLLRASLDELLKKFQIVHITGKGGIDISVKKTGYVQYEYLDDQLKDVYAMSEMLVMRAGANSLAEAAMLKKKALLIPLVLGSRGDQMQNAKAFAELHGWSVLSGEIAAEDFVKAISLAFGNDFKGEFLNGLDKVVDLILKTASK